MNIRHSLLGKHLLLVATALVLWPLIPALYYLPSYLAKKDTRYDAQTLEQMWQTEAAHLSKEPASTINQRLSSLKAHYKEANLYWVDAAGTSHFILNRPPNVPEQWTYRDSVTLIEQSKRPDLFTATAFIGNDPAQGFMVFHIPTSFTTLAVQPLYKENLLSGLLILALGSLMVLSLLFFFRIRSRLVRLQVAMSDPGAGGIPAAVVIRNRDEIGRLEDAFNGMIDKLKSSREREQEEERLRKQLIANISHDLRTPLTVIRQYVYSLQKAPSDPRSAIWLQTIEKKLHDIGNSIDNLLSYTLLSAHKYPMKKKDIDVLEELRSALAEWYPVFEQQSFEVDIALPEKPWIWNVDPSCFRSIIDNLFQNVIRHTKSGQYVGIGTAYMHETPFLVIKDRGPGMEHRSQEPGAGIGLSIISLLIREMELEWEISSSPEGTAIYLGKS
jgi:Signal transduction histidine kinase